MVSCSEAELDVFSRGMKKPRQLPMNIFGDATWVPISFLYQRPLNISSELRAGERCPECVLLGVSDDSIAWPTT